MEVDSWATDAMSLCRLCGLYGHHNEDIFDNTLSTVNYIPKPNDLREKIFTCVGIRVERTNNMPTKICGKCSAQIDHIARFRDYCVMTDVDLKTLFGATTTDDVALQANDYEIMEPNMSRDDFNFISEEKLNVAPASQSVPFSGVSDEDFISVNGSVSENGGKAINITGENNVTQGGYFKHHADDDTNTSGLSAAELSTSKAIESMEFTSESMEEIPITRDVISGNKNPADRLEKRVTRKVTRSDIEFAVKCQSAGACNDFFQCRDAFLFHRATYHAKGIVRQYSCHLCQKMYGSKSNLQTHMNDNHIGIKRFKCPIAHCLKKFSRKNTLNTHINGIHTQSNVFKCALCPGKSCYKSNIRKHLAKMHNMSTHDAMQPTVNGC